MSIMTQCTRLQIYASPQLNGSMICHLLPYHLVNTLILWYLSYVYYHMIKHLATACSKLCSISKCTSNPLKPKIHVCPMYTTLKLRTYTCVLTHCLLVHLIVMPHLSNGQQQVLYTCILHDYNTCTDIKSVRVYWRLLHEFML